MIEKIKNIYETLYELNLEAAEEEYQEYFQHEYSPERLNGLQNVEEVRRELRYLAKEILSDTGSEEITRELLKEAGAEEELIQEIFLA